MTEDQQAFFDLLTWDEIADALKKRCDGVLLAFIKNKGNGREESLAIWRGGSVLGYGLAMLAADDAKEYLRDYTRIREDGDDA